MRQGLLLGAAGAVALGLGIVPTRGVRGNVIAHDAVEAAPTSAKESAREVVEAFGEGAPSCGSFVDAATGVKVTIRIVVELDEPREWGSEFIMQSLASRATIDIGADGIESSGVLMAPGGWYHAAVVFGPSGEELWLHGVPVTDVMAAAEDTTPVDGARGMPGIFTIEPRDVRYYDYTLTPEEVEALYENVPTPGAALCFVLLATARRRRT